VRIEPDFVARTEVPETIPTFLRQRRRWIGGAAETLFRYRQLVGQRRYGALGMLHLAHNTVVLAQPVAVAGLLLMGVLAWGSLPLEAFFAIVGIPLLAKIGLNQLIVLARLWIYRRDVGPRGTSYRLGLLEELIRPFLYRPLQLVSYLWGYWTALGRSRVW
jgi:cellulose synthase/poly-beta-1,6-N-acetylglucosamine synthase-like glycosyltransferase